MRAADTVTSTTLYRSALETFRSRFFSEPTVFRAPGRVNLIGEHTDYSDGFMMPAALGLATYVAVGPREDRELHVFSIDFNELRIFSLDSLGLGPTKHWSDYVRGVAGVLLARGLDLRGANLVIQGGVPLGAGLSSSAALEVSSALALLHNAGLSLDRREVALVCQQAEHQYAGTLCGIMDQFISCFGRAGNALLLDCRSLEHELLPLRDGYSIVICNTCVRHDLATGEYNKRRKDCEEAVEFLRAKLPAIRALRDVSLVELESYGGGMNARAYRRAHHVISENERTVEAAACLKLGDMERFGQLMGESHKSLRDDFEVSCSELDVLVSSAMQIEGVLGSRMTGGGFGGSTVTIVREATVAHFQQEIAARYQAATGITPQIYACDAADGAGLATEECN